MPTTEERFWAKVRKASGDACWEWQASKTHWGYGRFYNRKKRLVERAHRFSWELQGAPIPAGLNVLHRCDNPSCVRPDHLFLGTFKDNARDMVNKGRCRPGRFPGVKNPKAKLSPEQVRQIFERNKSGESQSSLAREFGVTSNAVRGIVIGEKWRHLGLKEVAR